MNDKILKLISSSNRDDYILGMEYYCREKGLEYFQNYLNRGKGFGFYSVKFEELEIKIRNTILKLPDGIAIVTVSTDVPYIGRWSDYHKMTPGVYTDFWVHEIMDI